MSSQDREFKASGSPCPTKAHCTRSLSSKPRPGAPQGGLQSTAEALGDPPRGYRRPRRKEVRNEPGVLLLANTARPPAPANTTFSDTIWRHETPNRPHLPPRWDGDAVSQVMLLWRQVLRTPRPKSAPRPVLCFQSLPKARRASFQDERDTIKGTVS